MRMRLTLGLIALAVGLAGCEMGVEMKVDPEGSGTFTMVFGAPSQFLALAGEQDPFADVRRDLSEAPFEVEIEEYARGDVRGIRASFEFESTADLLQKMEAAGDGGEGFGEFVLEKTSSGWTFRASGSGPGLGGLTNGPGSNPFEQPVPDDEINPFGPGGSGFDDAQLDSLLRIHFSVTLPGSPASSNADEVERTGGSTTFTWRPKASEANAVEMIAETKGFGGGFSKPLAGGLALLLAGGVAFLLVRRHRGGGPPVAPVLEGPGFDTLPGAETLPLPESEAARRSVS